jgi:hypothetical protein
VCQNIISFVCSDGDTTWVPSLFLHHVHLADSEGPAMHAKQSKPGTAAHQRAQLRGIWSDQLSHPSAPAGRVMRVMHAASQHPLSAILTGT